MNESGQIVTRCDSATGSEGKRFDTMDMPTMTKGPDGFLKGEAQVTRTGVFKYRNADGSYQHELRHPKDVLDSDSLDTMKMIPAVMDHPASGKVTPENAKQLQVGHTGENYRVKNSTVVTPLAITDGNAIRQVESGKNQLSLGYSSFVVPENGTYEGQPYTHRQTAIRYNHLAIVDSARMGADCKMKLDSGDAELVDSAVEPQQSQHRDQGDFSMTPEQLAALAAFNAMQSVRIDGIEYRAAPQVINALNAASAAAASAAETAKATQTKLDTANGRADGAEAELKKAKDALPAQITEGVRARVTLLDSAAVILGDALDPNLADRKIMEAAILKASPETKLDGQSDAYVQARFDMSVESAGNKNQAGNRAKAAGYTGEPEKRGDNTNNRNNGQQRVDSVTSRTAYIDRLKADSRKVPGQKQA